jgi:hypothetical protein
MTLDCLFLTEELSLKNNNSPLAKDYLRDLKKTKD